MMTRMIPYLKPTVELTTLLRLMGGEATLPPEADKERFMVLVKKNRMELMAAENLAGGMPETNRDEETLHMMRQVSMLGYLIRFFEKASIRCLSVKGPAMVLELYGILGLRSCHDLDLLVEKSQVDRATELLQRDGWQWHEQQTLTTPKRLAESKHTQNHYLFRKGELYLELHWRLLPWRCDAFEALWTNRRKVTLGGAQVPVPGKVDQMYLQVVHNTRHGYHRLKWLADMLQMVCGSAGEMDILWRRMEKDDQQLMLLMAMLLLQRLPMLEVPEAVFGGYRFSRKEQGVLAETGRQGDKLLCKAQRLTDELLSLMEGTGDREASPAYYHYFHQLPHPLNQKYLPQRLLLRLRPRVWLWQWVDLPDGWYWLYWILRPVHKLWKILRGQ